MCDLARAFLKGVSIGRAWLVANKEEETQSPFRIDPCFSFPWPLADYSPALTSL